MKQAERPGLHRWTRHEYERLIDHGFLDEDDPIELLDGLLLVKEPLSFEGRRGEFGGIHPSNIRLVGGIIPSPHFR